MDKPTIGLDHIRMVEKLTKINKTATDVVAKIEVEKLKRSHK
jgi:hypothetical protein